MKKSSCRKIPKRMRETAENGAANADCLGSCRISESMVRSLSAMPRCMGSRFFLFAEILPKQQSSEY